MAAAGNGIRIGPVELPDSAQLRLRRLHPKAVYRPAAKAIQVPRPVVGDRMGGELVRDGELLDWIAKLVRDVVPAPVVAGRAS